MLGDVYGDRYGYLSDSASGMLIFGLGCGVITIIIRLFGAYPEGVSFAILIMNALVPLINKGFKPRIFGKIKQ
jgi:electron transport complex protein RnfD